MKVLKLSAQGLPQSWISLEQAVLHYATGDVRWEVGQQVSVFHGSGSTFSLLQCDTKRFHCDAAASASFLPTAEYASAATRARTAAAPCGSGGAPLSKGPTHTVCWGPPPRVTFRGCI